MAIINRLPSGLLSFLDQQTQGKNPQEPQPGLFLTSEIDAFYRSQILIGQQSIANVTTTTLTNVVNTSAASIVVPEGFVWEIFAIEARLNPNGVLGATLSVTNQVQLRIPFNLGGVGLDIPLAQDRQSMAAGDATTEFCSSVWQPQQRLILAPGITIRAQITEANATIIGLVGVQHTLNVARFAYRV